MTQHNQAPRQPRGPPGMFKTKLLFESLASWHVTALAPLAPSSRTDYRHTTRAVGDCITPQCPDPATAPLGEKELMGEQWPAQVPLHAAVHQAPSDSVPAEAPSILNKRQFTHKVITCCRCFSHPSFLGMMLLLLLEKHTSVTFGI